MRATKSENARQANARRQQPAGGQPDWGKLLQDAVTTPGVISQAYSRFWNYSVGNQLMALFECLLRGIEPGPIHTFKGWLDVGRHVKKSEKAITLCMPVQLKRKLSESLPGTAPVRVGDGAERQITGPGGIVPEPKAGLVTVTVFTFKPHWFVLSQTEGAEYVPTEMPQWSEQVALHALLIDRVPFEHVNGNCQGYATGRRVAVSPLAALPHKTLFHEFAHVVIGHTDDGNMLPAGKQPTDCSPIVLRQLLAPPGLEGESRTTVEDHEGAD
jgi:hypothetical protein